MFGFDRLCKELENKKFSNMYHNDFLLTWDKTQDELESIFLVADLLRTLSEDNIDTRMFKSGLGISLFRDSSVRTRFSYTSSCNLLGLTVQDYDESKGHAGHGETIRETVNMFSFMADIIGIRDSDYLGRGQNFLKDVAKYLNQGYEEGILRSRPSVINLQCDVDHPTQSMADALHLINHFGGIENLKGKKIAMTWAYSPSYGKPLSVPQGVIGLMTRFGMDVRLAYPKGYELIPETEKLAADQSKAFGGKYKKCGSMEEAFEGADIVYPKSWAPYDLMAQRTEMYDNNNLEGIKSLEQDMLKHNEDFTNWHCDEKIMKSTKDGNALYMHCLPADITGLSCPKGEVEESVFERNRVAMYKEASYKPYIIAAMTALSKIKDPVNVLKKLKKEGIQRHL